MKDEKVETKILEWKSRTYAWQGIGGMKSGQGRLVGKIKRKGKKKDGEKLDKVENGAIDEKGKG